MKILIADDSPVMRQIVTRTLSQAGFSGHDLVEAGNGRQAFDAAVAQRPDFILSDWNMSEMTGVEVLLRLRAGGVQIPFGFVTSEATQDMHAAATAAGALFLITKPFTADTFREVLDSILG